MTGLTARGLAQRLHLRQGEHFFIAGLVHGTGKLIFYRIPRPLSPVLERTGPVQQARIAAEIETYTKEIFQTIRPGAAVVS